MRISIETIPRDGNARNPTEADVDKFLVRRDPSDKCIVDSFTIRSSCVT